MPRRMSVSMTLDAVRARTKIVTRRRVDTWRDLQPGDRLTLIEKGMGRPRGAKQVVVCEVEVVDVRVEPLYAITEDEVIAEGFPNMTPGEFCDFWMSGHGYNPRTQTEAMAIECRRIEWRYLDDEGRDGANTEPASPYVCGRCHLPILDMPHTDPETDEDVHEAECLFCHPELRTPDQAHLPSADDERHAASQRAHGPMPSEVTILGHGELDRDQAARAEAAGWIPGERA